ncbi:MAG: MBL fold metallo-hydrolase [Myxococcales bacterium]|nr:MBL fold metallo-hydrolase [Myxococcales bacterium]
MKIEAFHDKRTDTLTYVVYDPQSRDAIVIDPVHDYEPVGSKVFTESVDRVVAWLKKHELKLRAILETHAHADHLSGSQLLKETWPEATLAIGARITEVQRLFRDYFDLGDDFPVDGSQFDKLFADGETWAAGTIEVEVIYTPGHTPACATYRIGDAIFTGDALFMPDQGTGRCDFPGGSAQALYKSINKLYAMPDDTRVFVGHDYQPGGRALAYESTIGEEKAHNVQLNAAMTERQFVEARERRDATLAAPKLLYQSVQVNIDAGALPPQARNERRYLKIPVNVFRPTPTNDLDLGPVDRQ